MTAEAIYTKQFRLAQHYLHKLRRANHAYTQGSNNALYGLKLVEQDWAQIQQGYSWSVNQSKQQHEAAGLCSAYPYEAGELLDLLLTPQEHYIWRESALAAARQIGDQRAELAHLLALGSACILLGHISEGFEHAQQALQSAQTLDAPTEIATAFLLLGNLAHYQERHTEAIRYLEQSLNGFRELDHRKGLAKTCLLLGRVMRLSLHIEQSDDYYQQAIHHYRQLADPRGLAEAELALKISPLGGPEKYEQLAATISEDDIQIFEKMGDRLGVAWMLQRFAYIRHHAGDAQTSHEYLLKSLAITRQIGALSLTVTTLLNLGIDAAVADNYAEALDYLTEAEAIFRQLKNEPKIAHVSALLVLTYWGMGDAENAYKFLCEALPRAYAIPFEFGIALSLTAAAAYQVLLGDTEAAAVLMGVVDNYPHTTWEIKEFAVPKIRRQAETLSDPATIEAAVQRGRQLDFDTVVTDLITRLQPHG